MKKRKPFVDSEDRVRDVLNANHIITNPVILKISVEECFNDIYSTTLNI